MCIERSRLERSAIAPNTFRRVVKAQGLLAPETSEAVKRRLAFAKVHTIDRFGLDLPRVRYLPPSEVNDELFFVEEDRSVLADNTFSFRRTRYEAPRDLRSRKIQIRFHRRSPGAVVVFYKGDRMGHARPVDLLANDRKPNPRRSASPEFAKEAP